MTIAFVAAWGAGAYGTGGTPPSANTVVNAGTAISAGAFLWLAVTGATNASYGVSDSKSNTWQQAKLLTNGSGGNYTTALYYAENVAAAASGALTVTCTGTGDNSDGLMLVLGCATGIKTSSSIDQTNGASGVFPPGNSQTSGNITPSVAGCLVVCAYEDSFGYAGTPTSTGFTLAAEDGYANATFSQYQIQTTVTTVAGSGNGRGGYCNSLIASFKPASGAGPAPNSLFFGTVA